MKNTAKASVVLVITTLASGCGGPPQQVIDNRQPPSGPAVATAVPRSDMSPSAQARAGAACKQEVAAGRLMEHRRGKAGLSADRVLLYGWGDFVVREQPGGTRGYFARSFVDTLTGYSGNVVRTPFVCTVGDDFVVKAVDFEQIQFPRKQ